MPVGDSRSACDFVLNANVDCGPINNNSIDIPSVYFSHHNRLRRIRFKRKFDIYAVDHQLVHSFVDLVSLLRKHGTLGHRQEAFEAVIRGDIGQSGRFTEVPQGSYLKA